MNNTQNFNESMYRHYLSIFHRNANFKNGNGDLEKRSYARKRSNFFGRLLGHSEDILREHKSSTANVARLITLIGDGDE